MCPLAEPNCIPDGYPLIGQIKINRPLCNYDEVNDPLVASLPKYIGPKLEYGPTVWGRQAYLKSFEKFDYAPYCDFKKEYPEIVKFADWAFIKHFSFLEDTRVIHITATEKNLDSTPAIPKADHYATERDYLDENGWAPYVREFSRVMRGDKPDVLWYLFLKKEILKVDKINTNDIRQILCADPIYTRIGACFESHQNQLMKMSTETSSGQCGWCPMYGGFKQRMERLQSKNNDYFVELDWTRFDGTIPPTLIKHIKDLRWSFINAEQRVKYHHMYEWYVNNLIHRKVCLPTGEITEQHRGNPSGQFSTTMDNNMINYWLQAFEFGFIFGCDKDLWQQHDTIVYGDDRLTTIPRMVEGYVEKIVDLYKSIFGMWVKPEKVKVSNTLVGLSFCGFTVNNNFEPLPTSPEKLLASLITPVTKLPDFESLHGKLLCYQLLTAFLDEDHPFRSYVELCLAATSKKLEGAGLPPRFTEEQLMLIWRGGPKMSDG